MIVKTEYARYENCWLRTDHYVADGSLCVMIWSFEEGPIARLTTCLNDESIEDGASYIDTNNCPWALDFIAEYGLGEFYGEYRSSGYCLYPKVWWDMDKVGGYVK